jgi:DNA-3-methyladenine glycosylase II
MPPGPLTANPAFLRSGPVNAVEDWLRGIKGIGPWSARFVLLRALGRTYVHPEDDRFVIDAASLVYGEGRRLTPLEVGTLADAYGAWKGYWAHYLWLAVRSQTD